MKGVSEHVGSYEGFSSDLRRIQITSDEVDRKGTTKKRPRISVPFNLFPVNGAMADG